MYLGIHDNGEPGWEAGDGGVDHVLAAVTPTDGRHLSAVRDTARQLRAEERRKN